MTQKERRIYLINELLNEQKEYGGQWYETPDIPTDEQAQKRLLRSLFNIRPPRPVSGEFLEIQDAYLQEETRQKGITDIAELTPAEDGIYLWQGDITTLKCDAIVNAANSRLLGCFVPCHGCIDNAIHTYAGVQLRAACAERMRVRGHEEETGRAKITPAFNLPCRYVLHTVGPVVGGRVTKKDEELLESCYRSCLELAAENHLGSLAFCCISTGEFHFPNRRAAEIAVRTVREFRDRTAAAGPAAGKLEVIFNVFKDEDLHIYRELLGNG